MKNLSVVRIELNQVRTSLTKSSVFVTGVGQSISSPSAPRNQAQLEMLAVKLKLLLRDLAAQENLAGLQKWNASRQSGSRWIMQQKEREVRGVLDEALALGELAKELLEKNGLLAQILQAQHHVEVPDRPAYIPPQATGHPLESATAVLAWVVLVVQWLKKKNKSE
jgi:reverse gyrase